MSVRGRLEVQVWVEGILKDVREGSEERASMSVRRGERERE